MTKDLQEWQWIYGKTPRFTVTFSTSIASNDISMEITSYHGLVESTSIHCDDRGIHTLFTDLVGGLKGVRFDCGDVKLALNDYINSASLTSLDRKSCYQFTNWIASVL